MTHYTTVLLGVLLAAVFASAADPPIDEKQERWLLQSGYTKDAENNWVKGVNGVKMRVMIVCENPDRTKCLVLRPGEEALLASRDDAVASSSGISDDAAASSSGISNSVVAMYMSEGFSRTPGGTWYSMIPREDRGELVHVYFGHRPDGTIARVFLRPGEPLPWP